MILMNLVFLIKQVLKIRKKIMFGFVQNVFTKIKIISALIVE